MFLDMKNKAKNTEVITGTLIVWLILMVCQPDKGYFMPIG